MSKAQENSVATLPSLVDRLCKLLAPTRCAAGASVVSAVSGVAPPTLQSYILKIVLSNISASRPLDDIATVQESKKHLINSNKIQEAMQVEQLILQLRKYTNVLSAQQRANTVHLLNLIGADVVASSSSSIAPSSTSLLGPSALSLIDNQSLMRQEAKKQEQAQSSSLVGGRFDGGPMAFGQLVMAATGPQRPDPKTQPKVVPESDLVKDLLYVLQGIDGNYIKYSPNLDRYQVDTAKFAVPRHHEILATLISETGWLFKRINEELDINQERFQSDSGRTGVAPGLVEQSFREGIQSELRAYWKMLAVLRGLIDNEDGKQDQQKPPMTLLRLKSFIYQPMERLKWVAIAMSLPEKPFKVDVGDIYKSDAVKPPAPDRLQQISKLVGHGDPFVRNLGRMLEDYALKPIVNMIDQWCFQGELVDPYGEFFIEKNKEIVGKRKIIEVGMAARNDPNYWEWDKQYLLKKDKIPPFISAKLAHRILVVGKSINFLRQCCGDSDWVLTMLKEVSPAPQNSGNGHALSIKASLSTDGTISASGSALLDSIRGRISIAAQRTGTRLRELMLSKYDILGHCETLKRFMFLGQGDLIEHLVESLVQQQELTKEFHLVYLHNLRPLLDSSIRSSSVASSWSDHLVACLDVSLRTPEEVKRVDKKDVHVGWDIFQLDYKPPKPLDAVMFTEDVMRKYRRMSRFLWRLRLAQSRLSNAWRLLQQLARMRLVHEDLREMLHQANTLRAEMAHFLYNFQYYIMFEVLESGFEEFKEHVTKKSVNLDDIIDAHSRYMQYILRASLLEDPAKPNDERPPTLTLIHSMIDAIDKFDTLVLEIFEQAELISNRRHAATRRSSKQGWGRTEQDEAADEEFRELLRVELGPQLLQMHQSYWKRFGMLFKLVRAAATVGVMVSSGPVAASSATGDQHNMMRQHLTHLAFRLDFNQFYTRSIEIRDAAAAGHEPMTPAK